ncbi:MAG: hypothetical protein Q9195_007200 [Heterodermia aff. obscurata]
MENTIERHVVPVRNHEVETVIPTIILTDSDRADHKWNLCLQTASAIWRQAPRHRPYSLSLGNSRILTQILGYYTIAVNLMPYSHSDTISLFSDFYTFLTRLPYIPISAVVHPPTTGWLSIDDDVFAPLGKTQEVLHLLRHLPYLEGEQWNIAYDTKVIPYHGSRVESHMKNSDALENSGLKPFGCDNIPAHVIPLTCGESYGSWLMCDTVKGTITEYVSLGSPFSDGRSWHDFPTVPIGDFLEAWKRKYVELEWVAMPGQPGNIAVPGATKDEELAVCEHTHHPRNLPPNSITVTSRLIIDRNYARFIAPMAGRLVFVAMNVTRLFLQEIGK